MRRLIVSIAFAGVLPMVGQAADAAEVTLKLGHAVFESHPFHDAAVRFKSNVERLSNGDVKVQIFPARQLGDVKELVQGVQFGTVDMSVNSSSAYASIAPGVDAFQLPWLIESYAHFAKLAVTPETRKIFSAVEKHDAVALGLYDGGRRHFLTIKKPVESVEDFAGLKTRVAPSKLFLAIWKAVGTNPTPMAYGEVYSALETGTLDAVEINITSIESEKYHEIAKNLTLTGQYFWPGLLVMNKAKFDSLTKAQQDAIRKAADEAVEPQVMAIEAQDKKLLVDFKSRGMKIIEPSGEMIKAMQTRVKPVIDNYSKSRPEIAAFVEAANRLRAAR